ncbi:bifunctional riboflavin kinase/FAD synthetase [Flavobacteriaceae bacterium]|jgi:riboflavin kinase/FMN adenylyltransferase|nr:bifunctional riboflavin kinase/FAD synthetase [Flavobacteriaceae bacterium]MBT4313090.1 bifunctional riboflavin kinase/FAD synthetase [Flavobacteriaceae bacterium]MBT5090857.1 bifunctional riboflavin kinase/FAD synthetase [Flavobacteriaceae bacterium]MBT5282774.1 bifunctional riboflavin kinase/FAD synthetase [Flavobacteriaceae bacterium]MBT5446160.1 bifunctional riboflavin kinase/FAD synthetase [Flavobacteriaceae bacterium]|tara:strand:+ start:7439 stop:8377 length:939 start_codon:yes stop_codon:yes gene_type:complete
MKVVNDIKNYRSDKKSILTIGTFDGIHIGHQKILKSLVAQAKKENLLANVLTFFPHPRMVLQKESQIKLIDTLKEREDFLRKLGVDNLIIHPFSVAFSKLTALEFIQNILVKQLKIDSLYIGYDHRFGRNREATVEDLKSYGQQYDFKVNIISAQQIATIAVSSTKIREAIALGDFVKVHHFLGRPFQLRGTVTKGEGIGRKLAFPTANLNVNIPYKIIPPQGVYLVSILLEKGVFYGMMNIGTRPTLSGKNESIEIHIFDFNEDLYGKMITVCLYEKIRDERKFDSLEALKTQLIKDKKKCKRTLTVKGLI